MISGHLLALLGIISELLGAQLRKAKIPSDAHCMIWCEALSLTAQMQVAKNAKFTGLIMRFFEDIVIVGLSLKTEVQNPVSLICDGPFCMKVVFGGVQK